MSNSEADVPQDTASDVIGNSRPSPGDAGQLHDEASPLASTTQDPNAKSRAQPPKSERTSKMTTYRPTRTSSAPPDEHFSDAYKSHFQPTKTQQSFVPSNDQGRRVPNHNQSGRPMPPTYNNRGGDESGLSSSQGNSAHDSASGDSPHPATGGDSSVPSSGAPSPHGGPDGPVTIQTGDARSSHAALAPLSPAARSVSGEHSAYQGSSGQNSPVYPGHQNRGFRQNGPPMHNGSEHPRSPYSQGQSGPPGPNSFHNNREPYNNNRPPSGDYRESNGRGAGRTNRRAPQGGSYGGRGPHMNQMHQDGPMSPPQGMNPRGNYAPNTPPQQQQQWVQFDPYTGAQIPMPMQGPPPPQPGGSPYQQQNPSYPAGAPMPPGARPQGMQMQGMQPRGPTPQQQPHQQPMFTPQHVQQQAQVQAVQAQQQQMLQQQQQQQNMMVQQHFIMHNQAQQQFIPQQMFVPYGMEITQEMLMMEMQNQHNLQVQNMQGGMAGMPSVVRAPNGQLMQVLHTPAQGFPMGIVQPQMQTFPHAPHMQQMAHPAHPGQQVFIQQEMPMPYGQQPQLVQIPMHLQQGGAPVPPHMQPSMIPNANFNNYPAAVTGMPHVPPPGAGHYNPNMPPQYGPQGTNSTRHGHDQGPGPNQNPNMNQGPGPRHIQKSPVPPRDHHSNAPTHGHHGPPAAPLPHASPYVPQSQNQGQGQGQAAQSHPHPPVPAGPAPAASASAEAESTSSTSSAANIGSAANAAPVQNSSQNQVQQGQGQVEKDKEAHKEVPAVVNPYQEPGAAPVQNSTPTPAKERKALVYKKKDGTVVDINSLKKDDHSAAAPVPPSSAATAATAATASAVAGITVEEKEKVGAEVKTDAPVVAKVEKVESVPSAPVTVPALVSASAAPADSTKPASVPVVTPAASATTSVAPSPRVSPKTVPSPETVPTAKKMEAVAVPTVEQQLKDLRIEGPSPVEEEETGVSAAMSPAIKSADLPVFIGTSTTSSTAATGVPSIASTASTFEPSFSNASTPREPDAPTSVPGALEAAPGLTPASSRSKKGSKKDFLAKADAASASSELSAYETAPTGVSASAAAAAAQKAAVAELKVSTPRVSVTKAAAAEASIPDSWDDAEPNLSPLITPEPTSASTKDAIGGRSLRPGGNKSFNINLHQAVATILFTKAEIVALRPVEKIINPFGATYGLITSGEASSGPSNAQKQGGWNKGGRGNDSRQQDGGGDGWKRDSNLPPAPSSASKHKKQNSNVPMPKKVISNQMELLATETMAILNKITPQTFEKLSQGMLTLNVQNIAQMSKVIELIFEKAVQEQGFANLYAELCAFLNSKATHWAFYEVFRVISGPNEFLNEFFWVRECSFPPVYAGPFFSQTECVAALHGAVLPEMVSLAAALEPVAEAWLLVQPDLLVKVYRNTTTNGYYVTYLPFSQYGEETRSQNTFGDVKMALKDAKNKHYFRAKLVTNCQIEFQQSTMNESVYGELEEERAALLAQRATLSEAEIFYKNADIDDRRLKLKRRMLGNIRFVGELFKQKLLTDVTIQDCISDLMGTPDSWKPMHDEQDIECLCHLLRTAGERLEAKFSSSQEATRNFNLHFERLRVLSKDKSLNSRMRFAIEEVLSLRENGWQKRGGGLEGPVKISEIHRKIQEESVAPHHQASPMQRGPGGPGQSQGPGQGQKGAPQRILPRPSGGGGGRGGQDVRKEDKFGRTQSAGYDAQREYHNNNNNNTQRPQGGEALRRVHSDYSPPISGTATPTSTHSAHSSHAAHPAGAAQAPRGGSGGSVSISEMDFSDPKMLNRAKSVITEFLDQKDITEVKLFFSENGAGVFGYFVLQLIDKYLNATKEPVLSAIRELLGDGALGEILSSGNAGPEIVQALRMCETLKCMPDTTMDIKEAPERFAVVLGSLLRCGALGDSDIASIMTEAKVNCIEELGNSEAEWAAVYARFAHQMSSLT